MGFRYVRSRTNCLDIFNTPDAVIPSGLLLMLNSVSWMVNSSLVS